MKTYKKLLALAVAIALVIAASVYAMSRSPDCNTNEVRASECVPANNRCTPPGDPRESVVDCAQFKYYQAP